MMSDISPVVISGKKILNLTPHPVTVILEGGMHITIPASGTVARVSQKETIVSQLGSIPIVRVEYGKVEGLPKPEDVDYVIVSTMVASALAQSPEWKGKVLVPNSGPTTLGVVRDEKGNIIGVKSLILY